MLRRTISLLLALVMAMALLSGCFAETDKSQITGMLVVAHERSDLEQELYALVDAFEVEYPGIEIKLEFIADYHKAINIRFVGKEAPDCCVMGYSTVPKEYWPTYLMPLDDLNLDVQGADNYVIDGHCYGYSQSTSYNCFMYNKQLWAEAGITEMPTTLDELTADLQKLAELDGVIPLTSQYKTTWATRRWLANYAGTFMPGASFVNWTAENDDPLKDTLIANTVNAFRNMNKLGLLDPDLMSSDWDLQASDFAAGLIATYNAGTYAYATMVALGFPADDIGFFAYPNPDGSGETACTVTTDYAMVVNKDCAYPEAAKAWVEFYTKNYANYVGLISPMISEPCTVTGINEMIATGCNFYTEDSATDAALAIKNLAGFDFGTYVQEYLIVEDEELNAINEKYNALWNAARAEYYAGIAE